MTIKIFNEEVRCQLIEKYADHFVDNVSPRIMRLMVWDQVFDDYQNYSDEDLLWEIEMNAPELLGIAGSPEATVRSCNH